jgi:HEAT repeat protein
MPSTQAVTRAPEERPADIDNHLQQLTNPDEKVRADVVIQLGRMRAERAVDPLAATLAGDASPAVRETAARALGLIGSTRALPALNRAAQADNDRDVRNSARFAVEVIQTGR